MAKRTMKKKGDLLMGLTGMVKVIGKASTMKAKASHRYHETPQVKGRIARAFAHETHGGRGKDALRAGYKMHMRKGYKQGTIQERAKIVRALAKNTSKGKGRIAKRPAYKRFVM